MTEPIRVTATAVPVKFDSPAEEKAWMVEFVAQYLEGEDEFPGGLFPEFARHLARSLPALWLDGELPKPVAELVRRFRPNAG
jgi:hypothetical protein